MSSEVDQQRKAILNLILTHLVNKGVRKAQSAYVSEQQVKGDIFFKKMEAIECKDNEGS